MAFIDPLESRSLFAADLTGTVRSATLPGALVQGDVQRASVRVAVQNLGEPVARGISPVSVAAYLRAADGSLTLLGSHAVSVSGLTAGSPSRIVTIPATIPANLAPGGYDLIVVIDPAGRLPDADRDNNTLTVKSLQLSPAQLDIALSARSTLSGSVVPGARGYVFSELQVSGNTTRKASFTLDVVATPDGGTPRTIFSRFDRTFTLRPGRSIRIAALPITIPADLPTGGVSLSFRLTPSPATPLPGDNPADNAADLGDLTILPPLDPAGPLSRVGLSSRLTFRETSFDRDFVDFITERGGFVDDQGRNGTYKFTRYADEPFARLELTRNGVRILNAYFEYRYDDFRLGGNTLSFGVTRSASTGFIDVRGRPVYFEH